MQKRSSTSVRVFYPRLNRDEVIKIISARLEVLKKELPLRLVVLFGSYAKGNYIVASDIDLLIVHDNTSKDAYTIAKKIINLYGLEPHTYSYEDYKNIKDTIDRMVKDGIILYNEL